MAELGGGQRGQLPPGVADERAQKPHQKYFNDHKSEFMYIKRNTEVGK